MKMSSALDADPDPTLLKCAMSQQKQLQVNIICIYCASVDHILGRCNNKLNDNREEPRSMPRDLRDQKPNKTYNRMNQPQVSHHQTGLDEGLNKRYSPNYINYYDVIFPDWVGEIHTAQSRYIYGSIGDKELKSRIFFHYFYSNNMDLRIHAISLII